MLRGQGADPEVLGPVRVLVLVDVEVAPPILVSRERLGRLLEQPDGLDEQIVEVERAGGSKSFLIAARKLCDDALVVVCGPFRDARWLEEIVSVLADRAQ